MKVFSGVIDGFDFTYSHRPRLEIFLKLEVDKSQECFRCYLPFAQIGHCFISLILHMWKNISCFFNQKPSFVHHRPTQLVFDAAMRVFCLFTPFQYPPPLSVLFLHSHLQCWASAASFVVWAYLTFALPVFHLAVLCRKGGFFWFYFFSLCFLPQRRRGSVFFFQFIFFGQKIGARW